MWSPSSAPTARYNILNIELARVGALNPGPKTLAMLDLHDPVLDFVKMAQGMGVEASRAETTTEFAAQFADAMQHTRPAPDRGGICRDVILCLSFCKIWGGLS